MKNIDLINYLLQFPDDSELSVIVANPDKDVRKLYPIKEFFPMYDEELVEFLLDVNDACYLPCKWIDEKCKHFGSDKGCEDCFKEWLESECDME